MKPQMNANTRKLHDLGQRIWLDNITREMLGTEDIYKIYAESFDGALHLQRVLQDAQTIVDAAIAPASDS